MGLIANLWLARAAKEKRAHWLLQFSCLSGTFLLALFYQIRFMVFAQLFTIIPLTALGLHLMQSLKTVNNHKVYTVLAFEIMLFVAPFPMLILPELVDRNRSPSKILYFPVAETETDCDMHSFQKALPSLIPNPSLHPIMNDLAYGPELLFRSPFSVLGAPFHTNIRGNLDGELFFGATSLDAARTILKRRASEYVFFCTKMATLYKSQEGKITLAERLVQGETPSFLHRVTYPSERDFRLYAVDVSKL